MADDTISARLVEVETLLEKSRKRFEEGAKLADEAHALIAELQQQLIGAPVNLGGSRDDADDVASKLLASLKAQGSELPPTLCGGRMAVDQVQRLIAITEMEYRVLELLAFARNNVVTRTMLLKHLYRRADDQPQPKIIDVFISKLRKKLRMASGGAEFIETIPQRGWILRDLENSAQRSVRHRN
jgi:exonuclease VII small subunit